MNKTILILLISVCNCTFANENHSELVLNSTYGTIQIKCDKYKTCQIRVNSVLIDEKFYRHGELDKAIRKFEQKNSDVYLLSQYNGDGCPIMYFILELTLNKSVIKTPSFGNCNEINSVELTHETIHLRFSGDPQISRTNKSFDYSLKTHQLTNLYIQLKYDIQ